jgi:hypothetical protein
MAKRSNIDKSAVIPSVALRIHPCYCTYELYIIFSVHHKNPNIQQAIGLSFSMSEWVTIRNARYYHIRRRRVPLSEVYSSISAVFRIACTNEAERLSVGVVPEHSRVGVGGIGGLPDDITRKGGRVLSEMAATP